MTQPLHGMTTRVHDYDEAIDFFIRALRFMLIRDTLMGPGERWVRVGPMGAVPASRYHRPS